MLNRHFHKEDLHKKKEEKRVIPEKSASELLKDHKKAMISPSRLRQPCLGRGLGGGSGSGLIDLSDRRGKSAKPTTKASLAKV